MGWRRMRCILMRTAILSRQSCHDNTPSSPAEHGMQSNDVDWALTPKDNDVSFSTVQRASSRPTVPHPRDGADNYDGASTTADFDLLGYEMLSHDRTKNFPEAESNNQKHVTHPAPTAVSNFDASSSTLGQERSPGVLEAPTSTQNHVSNSTQPKAMPAAEEVIRHDNPPSPSTPASPTAENTRRPERRKGKQKSSRKSLRTMRWSVLEDRVKLRELRNGLQNQRRQTVDADIAFMKALQAFTAETRSLQAANIIELFEQCQRARDVYQPLEDTYNDAEILLDQRDFELGEVEKTYYKKEETQVLESEDVVDDLAEPSDLEDSTASVDSEPNFSHYPPVVLEYFSRIGDADLIRERLDGLRSNRAALVEAQQLREPFGIPLDLESEQFLADFDTVHPQIQAQLADVEADISRLRTSCENEGFMDKEGTVQSVSDDSQDLLELDTPRKVRDPLLLRHPAEIPKFDEISVDSETRINKAKFIDRWLLLGLRGSGLEITRLKSMPDLLSLNVNEDHLNELVLEWWPKDKATDRFLSRTTRPADQSLTISHQSEEVTGRAASLGQPRRLAVQGVPFSHMSF